MHPRGDGGGAGIDDPESSAFASRIGDGDARGQAHPEVDDAGKHQEEQGKDQGELDEGLSTTAGAP